MKPVYKNALALYQHNWKSAAFSSLGIMIAAMALVISGHLMQMATDATMKSFKSTGGNTLTYFTSGSDFSFSDIQHCLKDIVHLEDTYPVASSYIHINGHDIPVIGSISESQDLLKYNISSGRKIHNHDHQPYAVVTKEIIEKTNLKLHEQVLTEEGVIEILGTSDEYELPMMFYYHEGFIFVSMDTFETLFPEVPFNTLIISVDHFDNLNSVSTAVEAAFALQFPDTKIHSINPSQLVKMAQSSIMMVKALIYLIVSICSILGGIGIMNMTIANITTRYTELALRVSFGATLQEIQKMLMIETALTCCISSFIGSIIGLLGVKLIAYIMSWTFVFVPSTMINSQVFAIIVGVLSSQYPTLLIRKIPVADILKGK